MRRRYFVGGGLVVEGEAEDIAAESEVVDELAADDDSGNIGHQIHRRLAELTKAIRLTYLMLIAIQNRVVHHLHVRGAQIVEPYGPLAGSASSVENIGVGAESVGAK